MVITIKEEGMRFGARAGAIIYNEDKTKVLLENQDNERYMFPGGRIDVHEDSETAIVRELKEELNLETDLKLKNIVEMFLDSSKTKYHEIGFYYLSTIKESEVKNNFKSLDGDGIFEWTSVSDLENHKILAKPIKDKIVKNEINTLAPLVRHISVYALTVEEGTPLAKRVEDGRVLLPDEDEVADFLTIADDELNKHGLKKYEISNFSVEGKESRHNLGYWTDAEYIGIGAGAHSYIKTKDGTQPLNAGIRFAHPKDINAYIAGINCAGSFDNIPRAEMSVLSEKDIFNERIMLGLRTVRGVESELLAGRIPDELKCYFKEENGYISLTKSGMAVMNSILVRIMQF